MSKQTIAKFKKKFDIEQSVEISTKGDFSHNVGLGSSSAVTVATFKALSILFNKDLTSKDLFNLSYEVNLKIQGTGSGFDLAASIYGKTLYFVSGGKVIQTLQNESLPLVVGYSGTKADTPLYVGKVADDFRDRKSELDDIFKKVTELVKKAKREIEENNFGKLGELLTENHHLLKKLGVSTPKLDNMVEAALREGAYGAKLSGAGGGDCMIALVSKERRTNVEEAIKLQGGEIINVKNNAEGVRA